MKNFFLSSIFILSFLSTISSQPELMLSSCSELTFPINDNADTDGDFNICEAFVTLQNSASYVSDIECDIGSLNWIITVDGDMDGTYDIEYRSDLPANDNNLDDTNNNGIPDLYIAPTTNEEFQEIELGDLEGPESTHSVLWQVSDACGVASECEQIFHVLDMSIPIPFCVSLSNIVYTGLSNLEVYAEDFNIGAFDNCTPTDELRFSFSGDSIVMSRLITCDDVINSPIILDVYVWDSQDNTNYCIVYLSVIPGPAVDCFPYFEVNGYVKTEDDNPIQDAEVKLHCNLPEYPKSEFTDGNGYYSFGNILGNGAGCYLTVDKEDDFIYGVTTLDLVKVMRHILGIESFTTPYQILASDVSGDHSVKASDLLIHRKLILGVISEFPIDKPWIFLDDNYQFTDPSNPWDDLDLLNVTPYHISLTQDTQAPYNFIGVKIGNIVD